MQRGRICRQTGFAHLIVLVGTLVLILVIGEVYYFSKTKIIQTVQSTTTPVVTASQKPDEQKTNSLLQIPLVTAQQVETSDYSSDLGFKFSYDKSLMVKTDSEETFNARGGGDFRKNFKGYVSYEPGKFLGAVVVLDNTQSFDINPVTIWVFDNPNNLSIDEWYKNYWYYPFMWGDFTYTGKMELAPKEEATISGQIGKSGIIDYQPGKPKFVYISKDQKMYLLRIIGESGNKILDTFKFN